VGKTGSARVSPPALQAVHLARPALYDVLAGALRRRITLVTGGPGWGKTTTLAGWAAGTRSAWLSVDSRDARLDRLLNGVLNAIHQHSPHLTDDLSAALAGDLGPQADDAVRADAFAAVLCESLDTHLREDLVLILDDVHELPPDGASTRFLEALCRQAPARLHLVLSARSAPQLRIQRLRGQGLVADLGPRQLAFDADETAALLRATIDVDSPALAASLRDLTGGWPAALRLGMETLRGVPAARRDAVLARLTRPGGELLDYLAEEVFSREPVPVREFLRRVAVLGQVTPALCEAIGLVATERLTELASRGLVEASGVEKVTWSLTRPVQSFLTCSFPLDHAEQARLHQAAAAFALDLGEFGDGLGHLIRAGDETGVRTLLTTHGSQLVHAGETAAVLEAARWLPEQQRDAEIERIHGQALQVRGDWIGALACFQRASVDQDELEPALALQMGLIPHLRGDIDEALEVYARGRLGDETTADEALLLSWRATAHWLRGEYDRSRGLAERASAAAQHSLDPRAVAASQTILGMLARSDGDQRAGTHYRRALDAAIEARDLLQVLRIRGNRGSHLIAEGRPAAALDELETAVGLAEMCGYTAYHALALNNRASAKTLLGRFDEAIDDYLACRDIYQRVGSRMVAHALGGLGRIYSARGEYAQAEAACEEALAIADLSGDVQTLAKALPCLARLRARDDPAGALALCEQALSLSGGMGRVQALLARSWVALVGGDRSAAAADAAAATAAARLRQDRPGFAESLELAVFASADPAGETALLAEAAAVWRQIGYPVGEARVRLVTAHLAGDQPGAAEAERELRRLGVKLHVESDVRGLVDRRPGDARQSIAIRTLGAFQVIRDGVPVPVADFQSKKARDLLKILVSRRGRAVPREQLSDLLWPDEDAARVGGRLSVLLSSLRTVLRSAGQVGDDGPLVTDRHVVRLDCDRVGVDVEEFFVAALAGLAAHQQGRPDAAALLAAAEERYAGDFLEEDPYEEWGEELREEARANRLAVLRALADLAAARQETWSVIHFTIRLLQMDPYDEQTHLMLVRALHNSERHGEARRHYRRYAERMAELGIEPAAFPSTPARPAQPPTARTPTPAPAVAHGRLTPA
jgi:ATP/maltotriose-dependent transcriptional regulator MalT/DNA-binding SARP family transcriptional activator